MLRVPECFARCDSGWFLGRMGDSKSIRDATKLGQTDGAPAACRGLPPSAPHRSPPSSSFARHSLQGANGRLWGLKHWVWLSSTSHWQLLSFNVTCQERVTGAPYSVWGGSLR